jgi:hypothetical protein
MAVARKSKAADPAKQIYKPQIIVEPQRAKSGHHMRILPDVCSPLGIRLGIAAGV